MKLYKKIIAAALALSVAAGSSLCVSAAQYSDFNAVQSVLPKIITQGKTYALQFKKTVITFHAAFYITVNEFTYAINFSIRNGLTATLVAYSGNDTEITVPEFVNRKIPVTGVYSFGELDEDYRCSVKTLNLPKTIKSLSGSDVFDLFGLENINVSPENPYITSIDGVVFSKDLSKLLALPSARTSYDIPDEVTSIGNHACYASSLESVTFPENLVSIGEYAFFSSPALKEVHIPQSTETIGDYAFAHCVNLQNAVVPLETELSYSKAFEETAENLIVVSNDTINLGEKLVVRTHEKDDGFTYAFYTRHSSDTKWHNQQTFSDINIAVITPKKTGDYRICAKIKSPDGTIAKNYCNITVMP